MWTFPWSSVVSVSHKHKRSFGEDTGKILQILSDTGQPNSPGSSWKWENLNQLHISWFCRFADVDAGWCGTVNPVSRGTHCAVHPVQTRRPRQQLRLDLWWRKQRWWVRDATNILSLTKQDPQVRCVFPRIHSADGKCGRYTFRKVNLSEVNSGHLVPVCRACSAFYSHWRRRNFTCFRCLLWWLGQLDDP